MFLAMSINTENSEDFLLWDISIFKNTVGSHRHLIHTTAAPAVAPVQVLFLQPSSPGVAATGRAWLLPAYTTRGRQQRLCSAHRTESQVLSEGLICGWHLSLFPAMEHSNQALEEWVKKQNRGFSCETHVLKCHWHAEIPLIFRGCWICRMYAHIEWGYQDPSLAMSASTEPYLRTALPRCTSNPIFNSLRGRE